MPLYAPKAVLVPPPSPQMHSRDYLVRARLQALTALVFEHLYTEQDVTVLEDTVDLAGQVNWIAGTTEWFGHVQGAVVSLGWDWVRMHDGAVQALKLVAPRTNIQVIDAQGYDLPFEESGSLLWSVIEGISWQSEAATAAADPGSGHLKSSW
jgi:hypothetical protein